MKKRIRSILVAAMAIALITGAYPLGTVAAQPSAITVVVDGQRIAFDQPPQMLNDRVMVQATPVAEMLGWVVEANRSGIYFRKHGEVEIKPGVYATRYLSAIEGGEVWHSDTLTGIQMYHFANGHYPVESALTLAQDACKNAKPTAMVAKPVTVNGYTLVALTDIAAAVYATTAWDGATQTVAVVSGKLPYYDGDWRRVCRFQDHQAQA